MSGVCTFGNLRLDLSNRTGIRYGLPVFFTPTEWSILDVLFAQEGEPVAASAVLKQVWGPTFHRDEAYLATWVWRLRQKIETDPGHPSFLTTVPRLGYRLDAGARTTA